MSTLYTLPMRDDERTRAAARQLYGPDDPVDVHVGWDADRATFFAQVSRDYPYIDGDNYRAEAVRVGAAPYEVRTARQALDAVAAWAVVPSWLEAQLERDAGDPANQVATTREPNRGDLLWADSSVTEFHDATVPPIGAAPARAGRPAAAAAFQPLRQVSAGAAAAAFQPLRQVSAGAAPAAAPAQAGLQTHHRGR